MLPQIVCTEGLATIWTHDTLVVVHIANMFPQVGHPKFLVTVRAKLLYLIVPFLYVAGEVV